MPLPPGPTAPRALQVARWVFRPVQFMEECAQRYGHVFTIRLRLGQLVLVADPAGIKQIVQADPEELLGGPANVVMRPFVGDNSILLLDGAEHLRQRKLMLPAFHGDRMAAYEELMRAIAVRSIEEWPLGEPFALKPRMNRITLRTMIGASLGLVEGERHERLTEITQRAMNIASSPANLLPGVARNWGPFSIGARFEHAVGELDAVLYEEIRARRADPAAGEREDVLSMLLAARDEDGQPMTDVELRDELVTLLVAGHETTGSALAWTFERLLRHPEALERLRDEVEAGGDAYLGAVISESLRSRPVLPTIARLVDRPVEIAGHTLEPGAYVAPCIYLLHHRADLYPDPYAFRPERFLERPPETYSWLAFGGGQRRCIGGAFAMFEMRVVLSEVLRRTVLEAADPRPEPIRRLSITLAPAHGGRVVLRKRRGSHSGAPAVAAAAR